VIVSLSHDNHMTLCNSITQSSRGAPYLQQCEGYSRLCTCVMVFTCGVLQRKVECVIEEMRMKTAEMDSVLEQLEQQPEVDVDEAVVGANVVFDQ